MLFLNFNSVMGPVLSGDIQNSLWLMLQGMVGIFIVMFIIYLVIIILSKTSAKKDDNDDSNKEQ